MPSQGSANLTTVGFRAVTGARIAHGGRSLELIRAEHCERARVRVLRRVPSRCGGDPPSQSRPKEPRVQHSGWRASRPRSSSAFRRHQCGDHASISEYDEAPLGVWHEAVQSRRRS